MNIVQKIAVIIRIIKARLIPRLLFQYKPLMPPTPSEADLIKELRATILALPVPEGEEEIKNIRKKLRCAILEDDTRRFLTWDFVQDLMFVSNSIYIVRELTYLKKSNNWKNRWEEILHEDTIGHPVPFFLCPSSSGNLIHHAYHLCRFEEVVGEKIEKYELIFEFGGGYGRICSLIYRLNFKGKYIIFDPPEFSALQTFFFKAIGIPVYSFDNYNNTEHGVICVSDIEQLKELISNFKNNLSLFIGTWSISEVPLNLRMQILDLVESFNSYFIACQDKDPLHKVDNVEFFRSWSEKQNKDVTWRQWKDNRYHRPYYLIGKRHLKT